MTEPTLPPDDPLEAFLRQPPAAGANPPWREALRDQTVKVLWRRRVGRRLRALAGLAACFLAGVAARHCWPEPPPAPGPVEVVQAPAPKEEPPLPAPPVQPPTPLELEWQAFDSTQNRAALYRQAGDRYLGEQDFASALRCYAQALNAASEAELAISPDDNWLVMALKDARRKERTHAEVNH